MVAIITEHCCGCEACLNACPFDAIEMKSDKEGFLYPKINKKKCTDCGICKGVCPQNCKAPDDKGNERFYGAKARDNDIRYSSSSGGVFSLLANAVMSDGGVVFGAHMEKDGYVHHTYISTPDELDKIRKTKYVQSEIGSSFKDAKKFLDGGKRVLFSGTPCQCHGLKNYLKKDYDNLLLVDIICFGVPSPAVWKKYFSYITKKYGAVPDEFYFRDKRNHDSGHTVICNVGNKEHSWFINHNPYCKKYIDREILRPSCHHCKYCTPVRESDITLGDFWGIENCNPDFDDKMGTSIVITHNKKGEAQWQGIADAVDYFECTAEQATQPRLCTPSEPSYKRDREMLFYRVLPFSLWLNKRW